MRKGLLRLAIGGKYVNMTDINAESSPTRPSSVKSSVPDLSPQTPPGDQDQTTPAEVSATAPPAELVTFSEVLYFAYRSFTNDPDAVLARYGFGRAHHRVLHFVHRNPGLKVAELLEILKITKQSLARVLKELVQKGCIAQRPGPDDLRERRLYATPKGARLAHKLTQLQVSRIALALQHAAPEARETVLSVLFAMIEPHERDQVAALVRWSPPPSTSENRGS